MPSPNRHRRTPAFDTITLSAYTVFLGLVMCCVELNMGLMQAKIRTNCGFLFSFVGRTLFLLLCVPSAGLQGARLPRVHPAPRHATHTGLTI